MAIERNDETQVTRIYSDDEWALASAEVMPVAGGEYQATYADNITGATKRRFQTEALAMAWATQMVDG